MNLYFSGLFILHAVTPQYWRELTHELGERPHGSILLCHLLKNRLTLVQSRQRKLVNELEALTISSEPVENVRNFNVKVQIKCEEIEQTGPSPPDLALLVAKRYLDSQVEKFTNVMFGITRKLEKDGT